MEAIETRNDEGCLKMAGLKMRSLATGVIVFAALFMMGLATEASAQSSSSIVVRARGTAGSESITLRVDNSNVATWTLSTSSRPTARRRTSPAASRWRSPMTALAATCRWITSSSTAKPASRRTRAPTPGFYANGSCGGGGNSEWMHCNGAIAYGPVSNSANSIVVRARGTAGTESSVCGSTTPMSRPGR